MNIESKHMIVLLTIVLIASGCTDTSNTGEDTTSTTAVEINNFEIIPNIDILSGQPVTAEMTLENTGTNDVESAKAMLFGPAWLNSKSNSERKMNFGSLEASSETSFPVSERTEFNAPNVEEGRTPNYNINAQVAYDYETDASSEFRFVSRERFRDQGYSTSSADIDNSPGPIQLGIRGNTPIRYESGEGIPEEEVCITVENQGTGTPFDIDTGLDSVLNDGSIPSEAENNVRISVSGGAGVTTELADGESNNVNLVDGDRGWTCYDISANTGNNAETTLNLDISASYNYLRETSTGMTVEGVEGSENSEDETSDDIGSVPGTPSN